jgi:dynein heavy chain 2
MSTYIDEILNKNVLYNSGNNILNNNNVPIILSNNTNDYIDIIKNLPENDNPLMFGLPLNVDRSVQRYVSTQVLNKLNSIYSISSDMKKFDKEIYAEKLAPLLNMWKSIFQQDLIDSIKSQSNKIKSKDPITLFIKSESNQICDLGLKVQNNLNDINLALTGHALITSQVIKNCQNLLQNIVPEEWSNIWDGPEIPTNYLKSLGKKLNGLNKYINGVKNGDLLSNTEINLSEFLHPEAFINALRQKSAREMKVPIDELEIICEFNETNGVVAKINGIFLQGADFDGKKLIDIKGNQSEIVNMPICYFKFVKNKVKNKNEIEIPLYENLFREHFICQLGLQFSGNLQSTILKGIALCLDQ